MINKLLDGGKDFFEKSMEKLTSIRGTLGHHVSWETLLMFQPKPNIMSYTYDYHFQILAFFMIDFQVAFFKGSDLSYNRDHPFSFSLEVRQFSAERSFHSQRGKLSQFLCCCMHNSRLKSAEELTLYSLACMPRPCLRNLQDYTSYGEDTSSIHVYA